MKATRRLLGILGLLALPPLLGAARAAPDADAAGIVPLSANDATTRAILERLPPRSPEEIFQRQCVPCHGPEGKGDGPAAVAFNPRPRNLTDAQYMRTRTDDDLRGVLQHGKGSMPAFGPILSAADIDGLIEYIRTLSGGN